MLNKSKTILRIQYSQGWEDETLLSLVLSIIDDNGLTEELENALEQIAIEENKD